MDAKNRSIESLDSEITRLERQLATEYVEIGRHVSSLPPERLDQPELRKFLNNIRALRRTIEQMQAEIARVQEIDRRASALERQIQENEKRVREFTRERNSRLADLGAGAYARFRSLPETRAYASLFDPVALIDSEIARLETDLAAVEEEEKIRGFFDKLKLKTRKILLRGNITKTEKKKLQAYAESGERVAESDFHLHTEGELRSLFDFVRQKRDALRSLEEENHRLRGETETLRQDIRKAGVATDLPAWQKGLERRIHDVEKEIEILHAWAGQFYIERDLRRQIPDDHLALKVDVVSGIRESITKRRQRIDQVRAERELEQLRKKEQELTARRKQTDDEIRVRERQRNEIDFELSAGARRMAALRRILAGEMPYSDPEPLPPQPDFYRREQITDRRSQISDRPAPALEKPQEPSSSS